jgi:hypothetical protein
MLAKTENKCTSSFDVIGHPNFVETYKIPLIALSTRSLKISEKIYSSDQFSKFSLANSFFLHTYYT